MSVKAFNAVDQGFFGEDTTCLIPSESNRLHEYSLSLEGDHLVIVTKTTSLQFLRFTYALNSIQCIKQILKEPAYYMSRLSQKKAIKVIQANTEPFLMFFDSDVILQEWYVQILQLQDFDNFPDQY